MCRLDVTIESPFLSRHIRQLEQELQAKHLCFRPHFWISNEWFTPDGVPGIAIPFYLAHPRLERLERTDARSRGRHAEWCMRILRHEAGHAIDNAYRLRRSRRRQRIFGRSSEPYPEYYRPRALQPELCAALDCGTRRAIPTKTLPRPSPSG